MHLLHSDSLAAENVGVSDVQSESESDLHPSICTLATILFAAVSF